MMSSSSLNETDRLFDWLLLPLLDGLFKTLESTLFVLEAAARGPRTLASLDVVSP